MTATTTRLPTEEEIEPWYSAVCSLWDSPALYEAMAARARQIAEQQDSEDASRAKHVDYFTALTPGQSPIAAVS